MFYQVLLVDLFIFCGGFFGKLLCADFSSESLWWTCFVQYFFDTGFYIEICLARISLQRVFTKNAFEGILVRIRSSVFFGRDSSSQFAGNVSLEILPYRFFPIVLGSDFSSKISWYFFSSDFFWKKDLFKVCLVDNYSSEILGTGFSAEIFLAVISLQRFLVHILCSEFLFGICNSSEIIWYIVFG